ncbi:MAG: leucine-rich repeat protein [Treponemataceae bacterium]|nr:leucine-rich repeat protein [Treponemataceae bacterium]
MKSRNFILIITLIAITFSLLGAQPSINLDNIKLEGKTYEKTGFAYIEGTTIKGSGSDGAFISGRTVTLSPYIIGKYPVTQEFYEAVAVKIPDAYTRPSSGKSDSLTEGETQELRPVERVDFFEVAAFCNKLSELQGLESVFTINGSDVTFDLSKNGWRIPTEAEWECAARGGNPKDSANWNNLYAGAAQTTEVLDYAWIKTNSGSVTHEVGLKKPNSLGLYDMLGNVYVWCIDLNDEIKTGSFTNPAGAESGTNRAQRGCSKGSSRVVEVTKRDYGAPEKYWNDVGFRLCRSVPETAFSREPKSEVASVQPATPSVKPTQTSGNTNSGATQPSSSSVTASSADSTPVTSPKQTAETAKSLDPNGWTKKDFTTSWQDYIWEFPGNKFSEGKQAITFTYKSGGYKLCLKDVEIIVDGKTVLYDPDEQSAGDNPKSAVYTFKLDSTPEFVLMKAKARTSGGTYSSGSITVGQVFDNESAKSSMVIMKKAGTLRTQIKDTELKLSITGPIDGSDVKYLRELINSGKVISLNLSDARIVSGGEAYYEKDGKLYTTADDVIGESMFYECKNLQYVDLPHSAHSISKMAFSRTGLKEIDIPNNYTFIGYDAFGYCSSLDKVVISSKVTKIEQGAFYSSKVRHAYVKAASPASIASYIFSSKPKIHVYSLALEDYQSSDWANFGTILGGLEEIYPDDIDQILVIRSLLSTYFADDSCTSLRNEYSRMNDRTLSKTMAYEGMPQYIIDIALKVKNDSWEEYEKDFRIHSYKAYSDANYWNNLLKATGGSYMGNPTGIYSNDESPLYVFVDQDIPDDATLYFAGCVDNKLIGNAKTGMKLTKGLNIINGEKDALYYILYTADTKPQTKKLSQWPEIKIHIEGGVVNGYYDVSRHSDRDYINLLANATHELFTVKGEDSVFNFRTESYRNSWPQSIEKSIRWFDSLTVREKELMGFCQSVASGQRAGEPLYLTGGDAIFPIYYNNPNFAIEGSSTDGGYANSSTYRTSYNSEKCVEKSFDVSLENHDDWCAAHECGHNNQAAINLEGCKEVSNNLFSNIITFTDGTTTSKGESIETAMNDFADRVPFFTRDIWSMTRMYYQLYLYYHQAQKNTSFYPTLFKELREDPLSLWDSGDKSSLKFVRKVCEIVQEDLTDFFRVWGFFEPCDLAINDYGIKSIKVLQEDIDRTLAEISRYPKKNRQILFIEDRVENVPTTDFLTTPGQIRRDAGEEREYGDLGQFSDYRAGALTRSSYTYVQADSSIAMLGTGGVGFMVMDSRDKLLYAANKLSFTLPESVGNNFVIYSVDADGTLHRATKAGNADITAKVWSAGTLEQALSEYTIKATISGPLNGTDIKYLRRLLKKGSLTSLDLSGATIVSGGEAYYETDRKSYTTQNNVFGDCTFLECGNLKEIILPSSITSLGQMALKSTGLTRIEIPDSVQSLGYDLLSYIETLESVVIGRGVTKLSQGVFYSAKVKDAYVYAKEPPKLATYIFTSKPVIHVYASSLAAYQASDWANFGTLVGDLK